MPPAPLSISIVTPSLNAGRYIEETIRSIVDQRFSPCEHIVVEGGSTDATLEVVRKYPQVRLVSEPGQGQTPAINKGIAMSMGEIFSYLNADDVYRPGAFAAVAEIFRMDPTTAVVVGGSDVIDDCSRVIGHCRAHVDQFEDLLRYWEWGNGFCIPQPAVFVRRAVLDEAGFFDERYDLAMDYEMWLRLAVRYPFTVVRKTLAAFRITEDTKTRRFRRQMNGERFRASREYWRFARWPDRLAIPCMALARRVVEASGRS